MSYPHSPSPSRPLERILKNHLNADPLPCINLCTGRSGTTRTTNTTNTMTDTSYDILYSHKHPAMIHERLQNMVFTSKFVCVRLEMITSPITLWGVIRMNESGKFLVETSDQQSYAVFGLEQVTSMGQTAIWITP